MTLLLFVFIAVASLPSKVQTNYQFSYFVCDPTSCEEEGPAETTGYVLVSPNSDCTGGAIDGINKDIKISLDKCSTAYIPYAYIQKTSTEYYDDDTCTYYWVDYAAFNGEVFTSGGVVVYHLDTSYGCDGSESGPVTFGNKPC